MLKYLVLNFNFYIVGRNIFLLGLSIATNVQLYEIF